MSEPDTICERMVAAIRENGGATSKELITMLGPSVKKQTVYTMIDRLRQSGMIRPSRDASKNCIRYIISLNEATPLLEAMSRWHPPPELDLTRLQE